MKASAASAETLRIFLVENHLDTLECLTWYLEDRGHSVCQARTLKEARQKLPTSGCNVLISDIGLPDGTGWDLLEKVTCAQPIYAVAMSGFGGKSDHERSASAGYRHHLLKPLTPGQVDRILSDARRTLFTGSS